MQNIKTKFLDTREPPDKNTIRRGAKWSQRRLDNDRDKSSISWFFSSALGLQPATLVLLAVLGFLSGGSLVSRNFVLMFCIFWVSLRSINPQCSVTSLPQKNFDSQQLFWRYHLKSLSDNHYKLLL